ncbi:Pkinase-domain-containing protein [Meredithblackwellia eburnea MCA 4105]
MHLHLFHHQPKSHERKKDYKFGNILGVGGYGEVKLATRVSDGKLYAVKVVQKAIITDLALQVRRQATLLGLDHPHVIKLHEWFESKERFYLVFELAAKGELYQRLIEATRFRECEARDVARSLTSAVDYLHKKRIVHRDIKLENVLYRSDAFSDLCLSDFGLAAQLEPEGKVLKTICGSPGYTAPEVYLQQGYGAPVDMWSLGVVVFCLMGGRFPYKNTNPVDLAREAMTTELYFPKSWDIVSPLAKDFVSRLLIVDPEKRMTAAEAVEHEWLKQSHRAPTPPPEIVPPPVARPPIARRQTQLPTGENVSAVAPPAGGIAGGLLTESRTTSEESVKME